MTGNRLTHRISDSPGGPCLQRRDVSLRHCLIGRSHERRGRHRRTYAREALLPRDFRAYPGALSHSRIVIGWHRSVQHRIGVRLRIIMSAAEKWENQRESGNSFAGN